MFYSHVVNGDDQFITVFIPGAAEPLVASTLSHANFSSILAGVQNDDSNIAELFDIGLVVERAFERIGERVTVKGDEILLDGDVVAGPLQDQILSFLDAGEDFEPLVKFWEKLETNPLGDVREGLFSWIIGQKEHGNFTITPDGDILGYKAVAATSPEWRVDEDVVYVPSRRGEGIVNGVEVSNDQFVEQVPGDIVEMPRSKVLNQPSAECGDGLHIGTYTYASTFMSGRGTVMLVRFSPRDIVSLPDSNSSWKLRVCRYQVIDSVEEPLETPVYDVSPARGFDPFVYGPATATIEYDDGDADDFDPADDFYDDGDWD